MRINCTDHRHTRCKASRRANLCGIAAATAAAAVVSAAAADTDWRGRPWLVSSSGGGGSGGCGGGGAGGAGNRGQLGRPRGVPRVVPTPCVQRVKRAGVQPRSKNLWPTHTCARTALAVDRSAPKGERGLSLPGRQRYENERR
jgi:hypothetical protein